MADKGNWSISTNNPDQSEQILYLKFAPAQGPLVVYRVHNDGPDVIFVSPGPPSRQVPGIWINPGCDSDVSGSEIEVSFGRFGRRARSASGTYELVCCQSLYRRYQRFPPQPKTKAVHDRFRHRGVFSPLPDGNRGASQSVSVGGWPE